MPYLLLSSICSYIKSKWNSLQSQHFVGTDFATDLNKLVDILRTQASHHQTVVFNSDFLSAAQITALQAGFGLSAKEYFTINAIASSDIPDPANQQVVLTAGSVNVLSQQELSLKVVFTIDQTQTLQFTILVEFSANWQFQDSFANLTLFPFDQVSASSSCAIYATQPNNAYYPWTSQPTESVVLVPGLNIASWLVLNIFSGALVLLEQILNSTDKYKFYLQSL